MSMANKGARNPSSGVAVGKNINKFYGVRLFEFMPAEREWICCP